MTEIDKMSDLEYQKYCLREYAEFFKQLEEENLYNINKHTKNTYYFESKNIIVRKNQILIVFKENKFSHNLSTNKISITKTRIPSNLKILDTSLEIIDYPEEMLPDNLYVDHSLIISEGNKIIKYFGKNTIVGGSLKATITSLESLENFNFIDLELKDCKTVKEMFEKIKNYREYIVSGNKGTINIAFSNVKSLPDGLRVSGDLIISNTPIEYIGKDTIICGAFVLSGSILKEFPNDIQLSDQSFIDMISIKNQDIRFLKSFKNKKYKIYINSIIKNIDELYKNKNSLNIFFGNFCSKYKITYNNRPTNRIAFEKQMFEEENEFIYYHRNYNSTEENKKRFQIYIKNMLLYGNTIPIRKKLLLENFENITQEEIDCHINISSKTYKKNNYKRKYKKVRKYKKFNRTKHTYKRVQFGALINFCRTHKAMEFIYKNGYNFNELEYNNLLDKEVKHLYLKFLIKKRIKMNLDDNFDIERKKLYRKNII